MIKGTLTFTALLAYAHALEAEQAPPAGLPAQANVPSWLGEKEAIIDAFCKSEYHKTCMAEKSAFTRADELDCWSEDHPLVFFPRVSQQASVGKCAHGIDMRAAIPYLQCMGEVSSCKIDMKTCTMTCPSLPIPPATCTNPFMNPPNKHFWYAAKYGLTAPFPSWDQEEQLHAFYLDNCPFVKDQFPAKNQAPWIQSELQKSLLKVSDCLFFNEGCGAKNPEQTYPCGPFQNGEFPNFFEKVNYCGAKPMMVNPKIAPTGWTSTQAGKCANGISMGSCVQLGFRDEDQEDYRLIILPNPSCKNWSLLMNTCQCKCI